MTKICYGCKENLTKDKFYSYRTKSGEKNLRSRCKICYVGNDKNLVAVLEDRRISKCKNCCNFFSKVCSSHRFCSKECKGQFKYTSGNVSTQSQYLKINNNPKNIFKDFLVRKKEKSLG